MLSLLAASILLAAPSPDPGRLAESQLLKLLEARAGITSGEIAVRVKFLAFARHPERVGVDRVVHDWFDPDRTAFRLDLTQGDVNDSSHVFTLRYAFDGKTHRLIDDVDRLLPLREFDKIKPEAAPPLIDHRLLGLKFTTYLAFHNYTIDQVRRIATNAVQWKRVESEAGFTETYFHKRGLKYQYEFSSDGLPISFSSDSPTGGPDIHYEARIEYDQASRGLRDLPRRIEFKSYDSKNLAMHEVWEIDVVQLDLPIDRSLLTWKALGPRVGAPLVVDQNYGQMNRSWNGDGFGPFVRDLDRDDRPGRASLPASRSETKVQAVPNILAVPALLGGLLAYRLIRRWGRSDS